MNNRKKSGTQKIQLTLAIKFMSSKDTGEEHVMHPKSDNKWITINDKELFESLYLNIRSA